MAGAARLSRVRKVAHLWRLVNCITRLKTGLGSSASSQRCSTQTLLTRYHSEGYGDDDRETDHAEPRAEIIGRMESVQVYEECTSGRWHVATDELG